MLDRELQYHMPFERLVKLGRSAGRKAFSSSWYSVWWLLGGYVVLFGLLSVFEDRLEQAVGIPAWVWMFLLVLGLIGGLFLLRRRGRAQAKERANYDGSVSLQQDTGGLRFATTDIEYYVKWAGISQIFLEHDGVVVSHGSMFFLVPDTAFSGEAERNAFIRDVYGRLSDIARERSEKFIRPVLDAVSTTTGT